MKHHLFSCTTSRLTMFTLAALLALPPALAARQPAQEQSSAQARSQSPSRSAAPSRGPSRAPTQVDRSSGDQAPRTAVPRGGGGDRSPQRHSPRRGGGDRGRGHGHFGHGHGHRSGFHFGFHYGYPYYRHHYYYPFYGYPYYYPVRWYAYRYSDDMGALDLNVRPKNAAVFLNGQHIGRARGFDGFPSGYLWLEEGTYDLVFYHQGYETLHRRVTVYPGIQIDVDEEMVRGEARPADEVLAAVLEERGELPARSRRAERERRYEPREPEREGYERPRRRIPAGSEPGALDVRGEPTRLFLEVEPADASIYLDGRFLGTGEELSRLHDGLIIDPGEHSLSVVRPGYAAEEVEFSAGSGEDLELTVDLTPASDA